MKSQSKNAYKKSRTQMRSKLTALSAELNLINVMHEELGRLCEKSPKEMASEVGGSATREMALGHQFLTDAQEAGITTAQGMKDLGIAAHHFKEAAQDYTSESDYQNLPHAWELAGYCYEGAEEYNRGGMAYDRAAGGRGNLAEFNRSASDYQDAADCFGTATNYFAQANELSCEGSALAAAGHRNESAEAFQESSYINQAGCYEKNAATLESFGHYNAAGQLYNLAAQYFTQLADMQPTDAVFKQAADLAYTDAGNNFNQLGTNEHNNPVWNGPNGGTAFENAGLAYENAGDLTRAANAYNTAAGIIAQDDNTWTRAANDYTLAGTLYAELGKEHHSAADYFAAGTAFYNANDTNRANENYTEAGTLYYQLGREGNNAADYSQAGLAFNDAGDIHRSIRAYVAGAQIYESEAPYAGANSDADWIAAGNDRLGAGQDYEALKQWKNAVAQLGAVAGPGTAFTDFSNGGDTADAMSAQQEAIADEGNE